MDGLGTGHRDCIWYLDVGDSGKRMLLTRLTWVSCYRSGLEACRKERYVVRPRTKSRSGKTVQVDWLRDPATLQLSIARARKSG